MTKNQQAIDDLTYLIDNCEKGLEQLYKARESLQALDSQDVLREEVRAYLAGKAEDVTKNKDRWTDFKRMHDGSVSYYDKKENEMYRTWPESLKG